MADTSVLRCFSMGFSGWVLIGLFLAVGAVLLALARKWFRENYMKDDAPAAGFTLGDLRELHRRGEITDEEYEKAKAKTLAATQEALARQAQREKIAAARQAPPVDLKLKPRGSDKFGP